MPQAMRHSASVSCMHGGTWVIKCQLYHAKLNKENSSPSFFCLVDSVISLSIKERTFLSGYIVTLTVVYRQLLASKLDYVWSV